MRLLTILKTMSNKKTRQCTICCKEFEIDNIRYGYRDLNLKMQVYVCKTCYDYEACSNCGYLGGASPCKWCRSSYLA